jgi:DNA-binding MarR family transcriptional regulator
VANRWYGKGLVRPALAELVFVEVRAVHRTSLFCWGGFLTQSNDSLSTARQIIRTVPLVMRVVNTELRRNAQLQDFSQVGLMRMLAHKGLCSMSTLADLWLVSAPTMSRSIRRLEERGWVELSRTPEDRRQVLVELTQEGQQVLAESY